MSGRVGRRAESASWGLTVVAFVLLMASGDSTALLVLSVGLLCVSLAVDAVFLVARWARRGRADTSGEDGPPVAGEGLSGLALLGAVVFLGGSTLGVGLALVDRRLLLVGVVLMACGATVAVVGLRRGGRSPRGPRDDGDRGGVDG